MNKKYISKLIARDLQGLSLISVCCSDAEVKTSNMKYLKQNKIFLISIKRFKKESENKNDIVNSILRFDYIDFVKAKNINQKDGEKTFKLLTIDCLKKNNKFEIILAFSKKNTYISLSTEVIEVNLEDQNKNDESY